MKRDIFNRGVRMTHKFGETEKIDDPFNTGTWDPPWPKSVGELSKPGHSCEIGEYGVHSYRPDSSPVQKPGGDMAVTNGPNPYPDLPEMLGRPIPVGTKRRLGQLKTDK